MQSGPNTDVSTIYVAKYNRFVDSILGRINKILRSNYDPVTVKLTNSNSKSKSNKPKSKNKLKRKSNKNGVKKSNMGPVVTTTERSNEIPQNSENIQVLSATVTNFCRQFKG